MTTETKNGQFRASTLRVGLTVLVLGAAVGLVPGCIVDNGGSCSDGQLQVSWDLSQGGQTVECAQGDEVDIALDGVVTTFSCGDHTETTAVAGGFNHAISFKLFDASNVLLSTTHTMSIFVGCGESVIAPNVDFAL